MLFVSLLVLELQPVLSLDGEAVVLDYVVLWVILPLDLMIILSVSIGKTVGFELALVERLAGWLHWGGL